MNHSPSLELLPAVDVVDGQTLRVRGGDAAANVVYGDPVDAALEWERAGARWIHLVDIDAAFGRGSNAEALSRVIDAVRVKVEMSGGIRDEESLKRALDMGCDRVNIGTEAVQDLSWLAKALDTNRDKLAVCLDVRGRTLAARGRNEDSGDLWQVLDRLEADGCSRYVVTDVTRDGTMAGANLTLLREVCSRTKSPVIASGGISSLSDIANLRSLVAQGLEGAIVGKALYANAFTFENALDVAGEP